MDSWFIREFMNEEPFFDRFLEESSNESPIDVVIPVLNSNIFLRRNLLSIYRELRVNRILVGDGGCSDDTLTVFAEFPRVEVYDHTQIYSLGASLKLLIDGVETDALAYLHSDVYLPRGFSSTLENVNFKNKWIESNRNSLLVNESFDEAYFTSERPYSGAQFGDSSLLKKALSDLEDDYLFRNEDLVIKELVEYCGGSYSKMQHLRHLHQSITKNSENEPGLIFSVSRIEDREWEVKTAISQYKGIVKYTNPTGPKGVSYLVTHVNASLVELARLGTLDFNEVLRWIRGVNPSWINYIKKPSSLATKMAVLRKKLSGR